MKIRTKSDQNVLLHFYEIFEAFIQFLPKVLPTFDLKSRNFHDLLPHFDKIGWKNHFSTLFNTNDQQSVQRRTKGLSNFLSSHVSGNFFSVIAQKQNFFLFLKTKFL